MESLVKIITQILDTYFRDCNGNRENQWSFRTLKEVILNEIKNYKPGENKKVANTCRPIVKEVVKEDKK